jgi:copper resistance protein C
MAGWLMFIGAAANAHAIVVAARPDVDAVVAGTSLPIELRFNSRIDRERSRLSLVRPDGSTAILPLKSDAAPDLLISTASGLKPGAYRLHWQVLSVDGHITRGDIPFTVGP